MYIDFITTAALARELRDELAGSRVQEVLQPDRLSITFELYAGARTYLTLTADGGREGLLFGQSRARRGEGAPTPLTLAARTRLVGARLAQIEQPPNERMLAFSFRAQQPVRLIAELTGKMANVILLDGDGTVVAAARHVTPQMTSARVVLPGRPYAPPPPQRKAKWDEVTEADIVSWCRARPESATWRMLLRSIRGMSPLAAREIAYRGGADPNAAAGEQSAGALLAALGEVFDGTLRGMSVPSVAREDGRASAYAPYRLTHLEKQSGSASAAARGEADPAGGSVGQAGGAVDSEGSASAAPRGEADPADSSVVEDVARISQAIELYETDQVGRDQYRDARSAVATRIGEVRDRAERRLGSLEAEHVDEAELDRLRLTGDMILTYQRQIAPGQTELEGSFDPEAPPIVARLDPALTPVENAQAYYDRYRRKTKASKALPRRLAGVRAELSTLEQLETDLDLAENRAEIDAVADTLGELAQPANGRRRGKTRAQVGGPLRLTSSDGFVLLVGRNSRQNEAVTFQRASRDDLWLHARGLPGGHVVVRAAGRQVPERTLLEAAGLALHFSSARDESRGDVIVTAVRHVRHLKGGGPGMVRFDHEDTVVAAPLDPAELAD